MSVKTAAKNVHGDEAEHREHRIRQHPWEELRELPEEEREHDHRQERLQHRPGDADRRLLVAHLHVAPREDHRQVAGTPELPEVGSPLRRAGRIRVTGVEPASMVLGPRALERNAGAQDGTRGARRIPERRRMARRRTAPCPASAAARCSAAVTRRSSTTWASRWSPTCTGSLGQVRVIGERRRRQSDHVPRDARASGS